MRKLVLALILTLTVAPAVQAIPALQIYLEGAIYDDLTESWFVETGSSVRLWTIGNVGEKGPIYDVKMSAVYDGIYSPTLTITGGTTGGYNGFVDPSTAGAANYIRTVSDGSVPTLGDGSDLPGHGSYGSGRTWQEFSLGDFTLTDSYITDFNGLTNTPTPLNNKLGQINVYDIAVSGLPVGGHVQFDLYDHYYSQNNVHYKFSPFSHDGEFGVVPEPGTLALLGLGLAGAGLRFRRRNRD